MNEYDIKIINNEIYINGNHHYFDNVMDEDDHENDLNKKVILALANEMGYEPVYLFEEMACRLDEMLDELD